MCPLNDEAMYDRASVQDDSDFICFDTALVLRQFPGSEGHATSVVTRREVIGTSERP